MAVARGSSCAALSFSLLAHCRPRDGDASRSQGRFNLLDAKTYIAQENLAPVVVFFAPVDFVYLLAAWGFRASPQAEHYDRVWGTRMLT